MRLVVVFAFCASVVCGQQVARPRITGVAHIGLYSQDIEKSRAFYSDFLGFQEVFPMKNADGGLLLTFFKINDRQYVEMFPERKAATDRLAHIAIETEDAAGLLKYLASRGVKTPAQLSKGRTGNTSFNVTDPDGHTVEFVQYEPDGLNLKNQGRFMGDNRMATQMSHVGIIVYALEPAMKFYRDILGCQEIWRGSQGGKFLSWVNMKLPDSDDYVEFMLYDQMPDLKQLGVLHHIGLLAPDGRKVAALLESQPGRKAYTRPIEVRGTRGQIQVYDPDGSRTEAMQPVSPDAPLVSSTAPPIR
jgi:catechol 2,3-dioxygenase-like lactoylglutathione lyase family enzyme